MFDVIIAIIEFYFILFFVKLDFYYVGYGGEEKGGEGEGEREREKEERGEEERETGGGGEEGREAEAEFYLTYIPSVFYLFISSVLSYFCSLFHFTWFDKVHKLFYSIINYTRNYPNI